MCLDTFPESPKAYGPSAQNWELPVMAPVIAPMLPSFVAQVQTGYLVDYTNTVSFQWSSKDPHAPFWHAAAPLQVQVQQAKPSSKERLVWADLQPEGAPLPILETKKVRTQQEKAAICKDANSEAVTMMLCNIPCRLGHDDIVEAIVSVGFAGRYDFVYLPNRNGKRDANIGYAFVNFQNQHDADCFADTFQDFRFAGTNSSKRCTVKPAHHQGYNGQQTFRSGGSGNRRVRA